MRALLSRVAALVLLYAVVVSAWAYLDGPGKGTLGPLPVTIPPIDFDKWVRTPAIWAAWILGAVLVARIVYVAKRPGLHKYGTAKWNEAFEAAGLIRDPAGKNAKPAPRAKMVGKVRTDQDGTTRVILRLPVGLVVGQVANRGDHLAAHFDLTPERMHFERHEGRTGMLAIKIDPEGTDYSTHLTSWDRALISAQLLKEDGPQASKIGKTRTDQDGATHTILRLPPGLVVGQVQGRRDHIAAHLDIPPERLHLGRHQDRTGMLAIKIDPPGLDLVPRVPQLPERVSWRDPVLLGRDMRGRDLTVSTWDVPQWLIGGTSGSGKTVAMRMILAHYALDPTAILWGVDGKGNRDDWAGVRPRFERWVSATDRINGPGQYLQMLEDLGRLIDQRQDISGRDYPGMLVLMDDAPQLRRRLSGADRDRADDLLTGIVQTCRAVNILCLVTTQKPSSKQMDTDQRSQAGIALCMQMDNLDDARMVLGVRPADDAVVTFPVGHGLLKAERGEPRRVVVDWLTDKMWADLGVRLTREAKEREGAARPDLTLIQGGGEPQDAPTPQDVDPLLRAAYDAAVAANPQGRMTTKETLAAVPADLAGTQDVGQFGRKLTALGWPAREPEWVNGATVRFRYAADAPLAEAADAL